MACNSLSLSDTVVPIVQSLKPKRSEMRSTSIRLAGFEVAAIKRSFSETFGEGDVYLFGSRTDATKRGGDIDLYLCPAQRFDDERERKVRFLVKLDEYIGEQKIDVVIQKDPSRLIEQEALRTGIKL